MHAPPPDRNDRSNTQRFHASGTAPLFCVCVVLLIPAFLDFGEADEALLTREIWNAGHIPLFFLLTALWLRFRKTAPARPVVETLVVGTAAGLVLELIQAFIGRSFSLIDIARDTGGVLLALSLSRPIRRRFSNVRRLALGFSAFGLALLVLTPLWLAAADVVYQHRQYPVLSDFETPLEDLRWVVNTDSRVIRSAGSRVLEVTLRPRNGYNQIHLEHFNGDWSGARALSLRINNTAPVNRRIKLRIHDKQHAEGAQRRDDRYNTAFELKPGWNTRLIALEQIRQAPAARTMNLSEIANLQLFKTGLTRDWIIYVDDVRLLGA